MTVHVVYRLTLDEDGQSDTTDYTLRSDGLMAFHHAIKRPYAFSARLQRLIFVDGIDTVSVKTVDEWQLAD